MKQVRCFIKSLVILQNNGLSFNLAGGIFLEKIMMRILVERWKRIFLQFLKLCKRSTGIEINQDQPRLSKKAKIWRGASLVLLEEKFDYILEALVQEDKIS